MRHITVAATIALVPLLGGPASLAGGQDAPAPRTAMNTLTAQDREAGWKLLFDGRTIDGWRGFRQKGVPAGWQVIDGTLTRVGSGGDLITVEQFENFELAFDWQISKGGNSGVMYRVTEEGEETYHTGPEYQILDNALHRDGKVELTSAGACYALYAPVKDVTRPVGTWNTSRIVVNGNHVEHWMNDVRIVQYELLSPEWEKLVKESKFNEWPRFGRSPRGHIALQDHGDRVAYRNIRIRTLPPPHHE